MDSFDTPQNLEQLANSLPEPWNVEAHESMDDGVVFDAPTPLSVTLPSDVDSLMEDITQIFLTGGERDKSLGVVLFEMPVIDDQPGGCLEIEMAWPIPADIEHTLRAASELVISACAADGIKQLEQSLTEGSN